MTVNSTYGDLSFTGGDITISCTPSGTPKAAFFGSVQGDTADDTIDGVDYVSGTAMTEMTGSPYITTGNEPATIYAYLKTGIATGNQDCIVDVNGTARRRQSAVYIIDADNDVEENNISLLVESNSQDDPSASLALNSETSIVIQGFMTGLSAVTNVTELSGWTADFEGDFGSQCGCWYSYDTIASSDVTCGYTSSSADNVYLLGIALKEASGGGGGSEGAAMYHHLRNMGVYG